jgi:hypothetical protein
MLIGVLLQLVLPLLNTDGLKTQGLVHWLYLRKTADAQTSALSSLLNFCVKANASVATLLTQGKLVCEREWLPVRPIRGGRRRETRRRKVIGEGVERMQSKVRFLPPLESGACWATPTCSGRNAHAPPFSKHGKNWEPTGTKRRELFQPMPKSS